MRIQAEEFGQDAIAAMSQLDRFQAGEQATLLFVEQAVEKQNSRFEFLRRYLESGSIVPAYFGRLALILPNLQLVPRPCRTRFLQRGIHSQGRQRNQVRPCYGASGKN